MRLVVIGSGYVGLVGGTCFADYGHNVICVDKDARKIEGLNSGQVPIYEPGLDDLVHKNMQAGRLSFTTDIRQALLNADVAFIAVGTPPRASDGHADLSYVYAVAEEIGRFAAGDLVVATKSTVPVGTGDEVMEILRATGRNLRFAVVSNPEFLREGVAISDFQKPDRVVLGCEEEWARTVITEVYNAPKFKGTKIVQTSRRSAEMIKYAANAFLATKITFINEISDLSEAVGADVNEISMGMGLDARIGERFLNAGPGYGGSCFPKDTLAISKTARDYRAPLRLIETVVQINDFRKRSMAMRIREALHGDLRGKTIAILGLTFKANTDDMRDSPAISIIQALQDFGANVRAFDPEGTDNARQMLPDITYCDSPYEAAAGANAVAIVTEWDVFKALDWARMKRLLSEPVVVDFRNLYLAEEITPFGLDYWPIGQRMAPRGKPVIRQAAE